MGIREWFTIPKYFSQQYKQDLSQSSLDLDSHGLALYRANIQVRRLAIKSYFGLAGDIDPQDMPVFTCCSVFEKDFAEATLKLLQKNMNRVLRKRNATPPQDGVHLCFWIHIILSILESTFTFPVSQTVFSNFIHRKLTLSGESLGLSPRGGGDAEEALGLLHENYQESYT
jgi:hypothetical protein